MKNENTKAWSVAAACTIIMTFIYGIVNNTNGVFITYVTESNGFSRGEFSGLFTVIGMTLMLLSPFVGKIAKKLGLKRMVLLGCVLVSAGYIGYSFSRSIIQFYIFSIVIGIGGAMCTSVPLQAVISNWFIEKKAFVIGIMLSGISVGGIISTSLSNSLILRFGWSKAYLLVGILMLVISIPTVLFFLTASPAEKGYKPYGYKEDSGEGVQAVEKRGVTFKEAKKTKLFWLAMISISFISFAATGVQQHIIPFLADSGYSQSTAVTCMSGILAIGIITKMVSGSIFDKFGLKKGFLFLAIIELVCFGLLSVVNQNFALYAFIVLWPFAAGLPTLILPMIIITFFGNKDFLTLRGIAAVFSSASASVAPVVAGRIYDMSGSYLPAWQFFVITVIIMIILVLSAIRLWTKGNAVVKEEV